MGEAPKRTDDPVVAERGRHAHGVVPHTYSLPGNNPAQERVRWTSVPMPATSSITSKGPVTIPKALPVQQFGLARAARCVFAVSGESHRACALEDPEQPRLESRVSDC